MAPAKEMLDALNLQSDMQLDSSKPIHTYLNSLPVLLTQGQRYYQERNWESAYVVYMRFLLIVIKIIPKHPEFKATHLTDAIKRDSTAAIETLKLLKECILHPDDPPDMNRNMSSSLTIFNDPIEPAIHDNDSSQQLDLNRNSSMMTFDAEMVDIQSSRNGTPNLVDRPQRYLRTIVIPADTISKFLSIAESNTMKNLETCAILCGYAANETLQISHILVPPQKATSDTCATLDEMNLFEYQESRGLMTMGWIHTHPSQTCFMSSVDLHTHVGYQILMPEAIAIVCAPGKFPDLGMFRLIDPDGVNIVTMCSKTGFHSHDHADSEIYQNVIQEIQYSNREATLVDMR